MKKIFFCVLFFISCFSSKKEIRKIEIANFSEISVEKLFNVELIQDSVNYLIIKGEENLISDVIAKVEDSILILSHQISAKWLQSTERIELELHLKSVSRISLKADCKIFSSNVLKNKEIGILQAAKLVEANFIFDCENVYFWNNGNTIGKYVFSGKTQKLHLWMYALSYVFAENLICENAFISQHSQENCNIFVRNSLEYEIFEVGNIVCYSEPQHVLEKTLSKKGKIIFIKP